MNTVTLAESQTSCKPSPVKADRGGQVDAFWEGWNNFVAGQTLEEQPTWNHKNGWWWALSCSAECVTPGYAQSRGF